MFARVSICPPRLPRLLLVTVVTALSAMSRGAGMASTTAPPPGASNGVGYPAKAAAAGTPIAGAAVGFGANAGGRTGILIHGCHLGAKGWQKIMWGDERLQRLGRLPHGVKLAWEEGACVVVLGTGASERDGVLEGRYGLDYLTSNWERLREFDEAFAGMDTEDVRRVVQPTLIAEVRSQNTRQELQQAGRLFRKENCDRVILVSSPTHLPRCLRDACSLWLDDDDDDEISGDMLDAQDPPPERTSEEIRRQDLPIPAGMSPYATVGNANGFPTATAWSTTTEGTTDDGSDAEEVDQEIDNSDEADEHGEEQEEAERRRRPRRRRPWRPLILASPSGTNYADYGAADVAVVEPPHRGDSAHVSPVGGASENGEKCSGGSRHGVGPISTDSEEGCHNLRARSFEDGEVAAGREGEYHGNGVRRAGRRGAPPSPPLLLHELVALALRIGKGREEEFRREFQALLRRYVDVE